MKISGAVEVAIQGIQVTVEHVAGATAAGMIKVLGCAKDEPVSVAAELMNGV